jgi:hypothetical protein
MNPFKKFMSAEYKSKVASLFIFLGATFTFLFIYQNCGKVKFSTVAKNHNETPVCSFSGAEIAMSPSSGIQPGQQVTFSVDPTYFNTIQWTFKKGSTTISTSSANPTIQTFNEVGSDYLAIADLSRNNGDCEITLQKSFQVSNSGICLDPSGINGPLTGYVGELYTFSLDAPPCFSGNAQWNMDYKINGVVNNTTVEFNLAATSPVQYSYGAPGTYTIQVDALNTATQQHTILTHNIQISGGNGGCTNGANNYPACDQCPSPQWLETNINNPSDKFCAFWGEADGQFCAGSGSMWTEYTGRSNRPDQNHTCPLPVGSSYVDGWWIPQDNIGHVYHRNLGHCTGSYANAGCAIYAHVDIIRMSTGQVVYARNMYPNELARLGPTCPQATHEPFNCAHPPTTCPACTNGGTWNCTTGSCSGGSQPPPHCTNGATNYPACTVCPTGQSMVNGHCQAGSPSGCLDNQDHVIPEPTYLCSDEPMHDWFCCSGQVHPWICRNYGPGPTESCF